MFAAKLLSDAIAPVVDLIYPPRCPLCGEGLAAQTGLCAECWSQLEVPGEALHRNGEGAPAIPGKDNAQHPQTCPSHQSQRPHHDGVVAATVYNDAARQLILNFKHGRKIALAPLLARQIAARLPDLPGDWLVIPVPLHPFRLWKRGFNQSALLAREIAKRRELTLRIDALQRIKSTPPLGGQNRAQRAQTLRQAICVRPSFRSRLGGAQVILVDDVLTSGATTGACVDALKAAGAQRVMIACYSQVAESFDSAR